MIFLIICTIIYLSNVAGFSTKKIQISSRNNDNNKVLQTQIDDYLELLIITWEVTELYVWTDHLGSQKFAFPLGSKL